jgi:hypothetical protein
MGVVAKPETGSARPFGVMVSLNGYGRWDSRGPRMEKLGKGRFWLNMPPTKCVIP